MDENKGKHIEDAPKIDNGDIESDESKQIPQVDELYAMDDTYKREEETAQEFAGDFNRPMYSNANDQSEVNTVFGWIGIIAAIASFFMWPLIMGIGGIVLGFISKRQGADSLGNTAIVISVISIILSLILPMF
ncbi:hypothetical protein GGQ92_000570 [Gracilibacillus halotolerans]|uniref:DUF4190 domain-containing protein n=1 Tax=Gracilibacillus halotolerans TaxID=74386 RepID=A0A841RJI3_9BACI|nr:DUF4190 domain-containing protein [Gracilibacillus halotolerans]MBB6511803.1 hypothetical protein [Gracilibacillus halotolerans]